VVSDAEVSVIKACLHVRRTTQVLSDAAASHAAARTQQHRSLQKEQVLPKIVLHNYIRNKVSSPHWLQRDVPNSSQNRPFLPPHLIHPSLDRPHSPSQTASGSNRPFCHSTFSGHTGRPTDAICERSVRRALTLYYIDSERRANNKKSRPEVSIQPLSLTCDAAENTTSGHIYTFRRKFHFVRHLVPDISATVSL